MNSSTSNSDPHRRFVLRMALFVIAPAYILFAIGIYLQPLYGDLTRIGFYAERDYGWNNPQTAFDHALFSSGEYDRAFDVVVLGDSFSTGWPELTWQNYLAVKSGWSILTLNANKVELTQVLDRPAFRESPPKLLIFETTERDLASRLENQPRCDAVASPQAVDESTSPREGATSLPDVAIDGLTHAEHRDKAWRNVRLGFVVGYLRHDLLRTVGRQADTATVKVDLTNRAPFSSRVGNSLLVYKDDVAKIGLWRKMGLAEMRCRIEAIRRRVEANGKTRFTLMVVPDKLTAYSDFVRDSGLRNASVLHRLLDDLPTTAPRLDFALTSAIAAGNVDVYLPDDTHWSSVGHRIAAASLAAFLQLR